MYDLSNLLEGVGAMDVPKAGDPPTTPPIPEPSRRPERSSDKLVYKKRFVTLDGEPRIKLVATPDKGYRIVGVSLLYPPDSSGNNPQLGKGRLLIELEPTRPQRTSAAGAKLASVPEPVPTQEFIYDDTPEPEEGETEGE
jgi:hypothetical protein